MESPLPVIANVSRVVTRVIDRITGDRVDFPLLVASAVVEALKLHGIQSQVMYGPIAWLEVLEDQSVVWAGCWGEYFSFWVATEYGEVVDLNMSVAHRKLSHLSPEKKPIYSPPILWSKEVPSFYRMEPEGIAEIELQDPKDIARFNAVLKEVREKCLPSQLSGDDSEEFPNEPILVPDRRILDDSKASFKHYDRALGVYGIPESPF